MTPLTQSGLAAPTVLLFSVPTVRPMLGKTLVAPKRTAPTH